MKKIVTIKYASGCFGATTANCPYYERVRAGWFCNKSKRLIIEVVHDYQNISPYINYCPEWCELEEADEQI